MSENNDKNNVDHITDLEAKLDVFLEDENPFDIDPIDPDLIKKDEADNKLNVTSNENVNPLSNLTDADTDAQIENKFKQTEIDKNLQEIKQTVEVQPKVNIPVVPPQTDKDVEKKFKDKQINVALEQLKARKSTASPAVTTQAEVAPPSTDKLVEKKYTDKAIDEALEKLKAKKGTVDPKQEVPEKPAPEVPPVTDEDIDKSLLDMLKKID